MYDVAVALFVLNCKGGRGFVDECEVVAPGYVYVPCLLGAEVDVQDCSCYLEEVDIPLCAFSGAREYICVIDELNRFLCAQHKCCVLEVVNVGFLGLVVFFKEREDNVFYG